MNACPSHRNSVKKNSSSARQYLPPSTKRRCCWLCLRLACRAVASGVSLTYYKTLAFGLSAFYAGVAGSLDAIDTAYVSPGSFDVNLSLALVVGAVIGGEGNGGVIDPRVGWVRDPFIGMALILNLLTDTGKPLSDLVAELPSYCIIKDKYTLDRDGLPQLFVALVQRWPDAAANRVDGLRLDWPSRWVHVRPSNTEPIVRVIAEAHSPIAVKKEASPTTAT